MFKKWLLVLDAQEAIDTLPQNLKVETTWKLSHNAQHQPMYSEGAHNVQHKYWNNIYKQHRNVLPVSKPCFFRHLIFGEPKMASLLLVLYIDHIRFCSSWTCSTTRGAVIWLPYNVLAVHAPDNLVAVAHKPPFACWACSLKMKPDTSVTRNSQYVQCISTSSWLQPKDMKTEDWK